jgi:hypothetical protein
LASLSTVEVFDVPVFGGQESEQDLDSLSSSFPFTASGLVDSSSGSLEPITFIRSIKQRQHSAQASRPRGYVSLKKLTYLKFMKRRKEMNVN